ncbi:MAG: thioredoxin family protein [Elusimicrobiota bacterium]
MKLLTLAVLLLPASASALSWHPTLAAAKAESKKTGRPIYLYLMADWCPPCVELKAKVHETPEGKALMEKFTRVKVNVDSLERWNYEGFGTTDIPTVFLLDSKGVEKARLVDYKKPEEHMASLTAFLSGGDAEAYLARRSTAPATDLDASLAIQILELGRGLYEEAAARAEAFGVAESTQARARYASMRFQQVTARFNAAKPDYADVVREADRFLVDFSTSVSAASVAAYRARALWKLGQVKEAVESIGALPARYPESSQAYWRLVEFSRLHGGLEVEALAAMAEAEKRFPKQHYPHFQAALWLKERGRAAQGKERLRKASELDPKSEYYRSLLTDWR